MNFDGENSFSATMGFTANEGGYSECEFGTKYGSQVGRTAVLHSIIYQILFPPEAGLFVNGL